MVFRYKRKDDFEPLDIKRTLESRKRQMRYPTLAEFGEALSKIEGKDPSLCRCMLQRHIKLLIEGIPPEAMIKIFAPDGGAYK